jgi:AraC-like DNA-binding protein
MAERRMPDFATLRFSTRELPELKRLPVWREEFVRSLVHLDVEPLSDVPFHAEATLRALPGFRMLAFKGSAMRLERAPTNIVDGDDSIGIMVASPRSYLTHRGQELELRASEAVALSHSEPATLNYLGGLNVGLVFPRAELSLRVSDLDRRVMRVIPRTVEPLRLLVSYITLVCQEASLGTPELRETVVSHIHDLAALALGANRDTRESGLNAVAAARLAAALAHVTESFTEPGLTLAAVAHRQGVTPRYLQRLLEKSGRSFTAHVNELRLQRAFALLTEPHTRGGRISEIALRAGFSDISHFNRLFRARFGDTPTGVRGEH